MRLLVVLTILCSFLSGVASNAPVMHAFGIETCSFVKQIADFGMSRDLTNEYYLSRGGKIPVKWTAPEVSGTVHSCILNQSK